MHDAALLFSSAASRPPPPERWRPPAIGVRRRLLVLASVLAWAAAPGRAETSPPSLAPTGPVRPEVRSADAGEGISAGPADAGEAESAQAAPSAALLPLRSFGRVGRSALTGFGVREGDADLRLGFFLTRAPAAFAEVPGAHLHAGRAGTARRLGVGFWTVSLGLLTGDIVYALVAGDRIDYSGGTGAVFYSLLGGSILTGVLAQDRLIHADGELAEATRLWNEAAFARARRAMPALAPTKSRADFAPPAR